MGAYASYNRFHQSTARHGVLGRGQHGHTGLRQQHVGLRSIRSSLPILMYHRTSQRGDVSMYDQFYGVSGRPFPLTPDQHFYFESATHCTAMSYLLSEEHWVGKEGVSKCR